LIAALLLLVADPAIPPASPPATETPASQAPSPVADADLREYAAVVGRKAVGKPVNGPFGTADKVLVLIRDDKGYPAVGTSFGFPVRDSLPPPPAGALAVVRLHQQSGPVVPGPTDDDRAFVAATKLPLFVIGEWARPAPMWELAWLDGAVRTRRIGEVGEIGPWQD